MQQFILEDGTPQRRHRQRLNELLSSTKGSLRIATAYVTDREFIKKAVKRDTLLLISLLPMDVASGATSVETLGWMLRSGVKCQVLPDRPRLHAKVYIFGTSNAIVTSANLTRNAFDSNIEVGVEINGQAVDEINRWFDELWKIGSPLTIDDLSDLQSHTSLLRQEYSKLKKRAKNDLLLTKQHNLSNVLTDSLQDLFTKAPRFFVCNTDRRQGERTSTGGFALEQEMYNRGLATAWEDFKYPSHMERVEPGDAIFMFAKGVGIIDVGVATAPCEILSPNNPDRVRNFYNEENTKEWRVPVKLLTWTDEAGAYRYKSPNATFWDVTGSDYDEFRKKVKAHFLDDI
ncbi:MAG: phospholipase D family protein [Pirellulales bacterium]|nr:phospholipase D family protein [Pirellulales bacterium]